MSRFHPQRRSGWKVAIKTVFSRGNIDFSTKSVKRKKKKHCLHSSQNILIWQMKLDNSYLHFPVDPAAPMYQNKDLRISCSEAAGRYGQCWGTRKSGPGSAGPRDIRPLVTHDDTISKSTPLVLNGNILFLSTKESCWLKSIPLFKQFFCLRSIHINTTEEIRLAKARPKVRMWAVAMPALLTEFVQFFWMLVSTMNAASVLVTVFFYGILFIVPIIIISPYIWKSNFYNIAQLSVVVT